MASMPLASTRHAEGAHRARAGVEPWAPLLVCGALLVALSLLYTQSAIAVALTIDGRRLAYTTHAGTVGDLLIEHAVDVAPGDLVLPAAGARLRDGDAVTVQRARPVRVRADGRVLNLRSHGRTAQALLAEAGVALGASDAVEVNGAPPPGGDAAWVIDVYRAVPITVVEEGVPYTVEAAGATIGDGLAHAGLGLLPGDEVFPPADTPLAAAMRVAVGRAAPFELEIDGETRAVRARAATIGEALADVSAPLRGHDYSVPPADTPFSPGMRVAVVRVREEIQVVEAEIPFGTRTEPDAALPLDEKRVLVEGRPGRKTQRVRITYEDGAEAGREVLQESVTQPAVDQVVAYGTNVVWQTVDTPEGPKRYWRKLRMYATSYSAARAGTPRSAPWYGRARNGMVMRKGIVATDTRIIPMGMWVYVPGYGVAIAGDTGGGVKRYMIDLGYADDDYQSWHQYVDVYILDRLPPEHQMAWILP